MDKRMKGWKISPFYKTSSPIGAAALPPPIDTKERVEQGKGKGKGLWATYYYQNLFVAKT